MSTLLSHGSVMGMKRRYRPKLNLTVADETLARLHRMVAAGLYTNYSRAVDEAIKRLAQQHERRNELPPELPGPGEDDSLPA